MCTHKETLNDEVYEIHYGCSRFLPPALEKEPSLCCWRTGMSGWAGCDFNQAYFYLCVINMHGRGNWRKGGKKWAGRKWMNQIRESGDGLWNRDAMVHDTCAGWMLYGFMWKKMKETTVHADCVCACVCVECEAEWFLWQYPRMCRDAVMSQRFFSSRGSVCILNTTFRTTSKKKSPKHTN